ncbi:MAG: universal stress protein [Deltaproteobacteria bacterium]|nr:universal stress protein [Deltaproteobacteria bacterium]
MDYTTIVCGVTGSLHSQKAALEAAVLASKSQTALVYVYVVDVSFLRRGSGSMTSGAVADSLDKLGAQILDIAEEIAKTQGVVPKKILRKGPVLDVLKQVIQEENADLLVLGHEDRTFFEKALFKGDVEDHLEELKKQTGAEVTVIR